MITYPYAYPIAFSIGPVDVHWYGLMYLVGFALAWIAGSYRLRQAHIPFSKKTLEDLIFYTAIGVILGGRLGYMIFYNTPVLLESPLSVFKIWQGGMSFHGALIGVLLAIVIYARKSQQSFLQLTDFIAPLVPLGLFAGRLGNFINGELWGHVTTLPWGVHFVNAGPLARHPSQLYQASLEGLLLFIVLWVYAKKPRALGRVSGVFLIGYSLFRSFAEFYRLPDPHIGYLFANWLTLGQLLSLPMLFIGLYLCLRATPNRSIKGNHHEAVS